MKVFILLTILNKFYKSKILKEKKKIHKLSFFSLQVIKMYAWEKPFSKIVSITRALEIKRIKFSSYVRAAYLAIIVFTERLLLYFTLIMFVLSGNNLSADVTYVLATFFNILQLTAALFFPQALIILGETMVSMNRLEVRHHVCYFELRYKSVLPLFALTYLLND